MDSNATQAAPAVKRFVVAPQEIQTLEKLRTQTSELAFEQFTAQMKAAKNAKTMEERLTAEELARQSLEQSRQIVDQNKKDFAAALSGLFESLEQLDIKINITATPEEETLLAEAKRNIAEAEASLVAAQQSWFFRESRTKAAHERIAEKRKLLAEAEQGIELAKRARLMNTTLEKGLAEYTKATNSALDSLMVRVVAESKMAKVIGTQKKAAMAAELEAQRAVEDLNQKIEAIKANIARAEEELPSLEGSALLEAKTKLEDLNKAWSDLESERNNAVTHQKSKEKFVSDLKIHEQSHIELLQALSMSYTKLKSDSEERRHLFPSYLEAEKAHADMLVSKKLGDFGDATDQKMADNIARLGAAARNEAAAILARFPLLIKQMEASEKAQTQHRLAKMQEVDTILAEMRREDFLPHDGQHEAAA